MLAAETGRPLVQHVVDQARQCRRAELVCVATDDWRIAQSLTDLGTRCLMTDASLPSGTDRVAAAARQLGEKFDVVVNVQGDEPEIEPATIDALIDRLESPGGEEMATAAAPFPQQADVADPNLVKVVIAPDGRAIYFSRSAIPYPRTAQRAAYYLHQGVYAYRRDFLLKFAAWPPTPLEQTEMLEQLRVLEHGEPIYVLRIARAVHGIDTPQQYEAFVRRFLQPASSN
jgi:3-deoxy-manno-octulosonate cytidylyltransferase (CMP-KDO synthetase)